MLCRLPPHVRTMQGKIVLQSPVSAGRYFFFEVGGMVSASAIVSRSVELPFCLKVESPVLYVCSEVINGRNIVAAFGKRKRRNALPSVFLMSLSSAPVAPAMALYVLPIKNLSRNTPASCGVNTERIQASIIALLYSAYPLSITRSKGIKEASSTIISRTLALPSSSAIEGASPLMELFKASSRPLTVRKPAASANSIFNG